MTAFVKKGRRRKVKVLSAFMAMILLAFSFFGCSWKSTVTVDAEKQDFHAKSLDELSGYVQMGTYKGLEIKLEGRSRGEAVWDAISDGAKVAEYPEKHVYYYINSLEGQYKYYAEQAGISYDDMLEELGINEGSIYKEAKDMTKADIIYSIIIKLEGIELTEEEKNAYFEKYAAKYVSEYGYDNEYVRANMSELIYDSMLYDKTTEFLIVNNSFTE